MSETDLKRAVTKYLEACGWLVTRVQCGGHRGRMSFAKPGTEDLACMAPGGRYVAVETKVRNNKLSEEQARRKASVISAGGIYFEIRSLRDAEFMVNALRGRADETENVTPRKTNPPASVRGHS